MLPSFGWSTVGAEQNDPDTLTNFMFGPAGLTNSLGDIFADQQDDYSSFGLSGTSKEEDSAIAGNEVNVNALNDAEMPSGGIGWIWSVISRRDDFGTHFRYLSFRKEQFFISQVFNSSFSHFVALRLISPNSKISILVSVLKSLSTKTVVMHFLEMLL